MTGLVPTKSQRAFWAQACRLYENEVHEAAAYLEARAITAEAAASARLGFVSKPAGRRHENMVGRLAIPYLTVEGDVVGFKFRCIRDHNCKEEGHAKYLGEEGAPIRLWGVDAFVEDSETIVVCEGELNCLSVRIGVGVPAVAIPGATSWQPYWHRLFDGYADVIVVGHGDQAGRQFTRRLTKGSREQPPLPNSRAVHMPEGEDENSILAKHGGETLARLIWDVTESEQSTS